MITIRQVKKFRESLVAAGIPLLSLMQENREVLEHAVAADGAVDGSLAGRLSGLHVAASHQSGNAFCATTNATLAGLTGLSDIIASPVRRSETPLSVIALTDDQAKLGKEVGVGDRDLETIRRVAALAAGRCRTRFRAWDRYLETVSIDAVLRNDRQRFLHVAASREFAGGLIEEQFVARQARDAEGLYRRLDARIAMREEWIAAPAAPLPPAGETPPPIVFEPYAAAQLLLLLLAPSLVAGPTKPEDPTRFIGLKIGGPGFTVVDDPTRPNLAGTFRIDEQGNPAVRKTLVDRGTVISFVTGALAALKVGLIPGPCRSAGFEYEPVPAFSNLSIEPDPDGPAAAELAGAAGERLVVRSLARPFVSDRFGNFRIPLEVAWRLADGERRALREVAIKGSLRDFFGRATRIGRDLEFFSGWLAQGDGQRLPQAFGAPALEFEGIHVEQN